MRDGDHSAREAFEQLASLRPDDALVRLHVERLRAGAGGDLIVLAQK